MDMRECFDAEDETINGSWVQTSACASLLITWFLWGIEVERVCRRSPGKSIEFCSRSTTRFPLMIARVDTWGTKSAGVQNTAPRYTYVDRITEDKEISLPPMLCLPIDSPM